jgi:hypothetical protein
MRRHRQQRRHIGLIVQTSQIVIPLRQTPCRKRSQIKRDNVQPKRSRADPAPAHQPAPDHRTRRVDRLTPPPIAACDVVAVRSHSAMEIEI